MDLPGLKSSEDAYEAKVVCDDSEDDPRGDVRGGVRGVPAAEKEPDGGHGEIDEA